MSPGGYPAARQHEMRVAETLLIGDGEIRARHRHDDARAVDHDAERPLAIR